MQDTLSRLGEIAAAGETLHHNLLQIMEAQEFRDVAGQMVNKLLDAAVEIEKILLDLLREHAPDSRDSLISTAGLTAGPAMKMQPDGVSGQDEVDDLLASMGFCITSLQPFKSGCTTTVRPHNLLVRPSLAHPSEKLLRTPYTLPSALYLLNFH